MNTKQREILQQHKTFLMRNIVWNDELVNKLLAHGVITDAILTDIQGAASGRHPKPPVTKLLEILPLKGSGVYEKFLVVLQLNGHPFIADFLRDEESAEDTRADVSDLFKRVPLLEKLLKEDDKKTIEIFFKEKIRETQLKGIWSKEAIAKEKDKAIDAKRKQLEDAFDYESKERVYREEIQKLEKQTQDYQKDIVELKSKIAYMQSEYKEHENKYKNEFGVQMKFSMANEGALHRLEDKYRRCEQTLSQLQDMLQEIVKPPVRNSERDQMAVAEFTFAFVLPDFNTFVEKYNRLLTVEKQYESLLHERNYILSHLGFHSNEGEKPSLLTAYRDFAVKTDEDLSELRNKLEKHTDVIEGQQSKIQNLNTEVEKQSKFGKLKAAGSVWQNAMLGVMRTQLNDVKHDNRIKETKVRNLEGELTKLKSKLADMEALRNVGESVTPRQMIVYKDKDDLSPVTARSSNTDEDNESKTSRRNTLLPPLGGKVLFRSTEINFTPNHVMPTRSKGRALGTVGRQEQPNKYSSVPGGLISQQMRLENKAKLNHMMNSSMGHQKKDGPSHVR